MIVQIRTAVMFFAGTFAFAPLGFAQTAVGSPAASVWNALAAPGMDPARSAHTENVDIIRDHIRINLTDGTIQFTQPVNGVVFGAVFHGKGRLLAEPPNLQEAQQLKLFTRQEKLNVEFSDATFSFTDGLFDEVAKQVKWQTSGPASDDLYVKRQREREDLGESSMPRLLQSILSADRTRTLIFWRT